MKKFLAAMDALMAMMYLEEWTPSQKARAEQCREDMMNAVWHHVLIPVSMGNGNADLGHKFISITHAFRVEASCWATVAKLCQAIISITSDYGVEHMIGSVAFDGSSSLIGVKAWLLIHGTQRMTWPHRPLYLSNAL